jgi:hypothetical protein
MKMTVGEIPQDQHLDIPTTTEIAKDIDLQGTRAIAEAEAVSDETGPRTMAAGLVEKSCWTDYR